MKTNARRELLLLALSTALLAQSSFAQTRRPTVSKSPAKAAAKETVPTFDTLLAADRYKLYSEVRGLGQLIRSSGITDLTNPLIQSSAPPKEFTALMKWLNEHADELMTSRMMAASWPARPGLPDFVCAIEFSSPEVARNFDLQLKGFVPKILAAPSPAPSVESSAVISDKKAPMAESSSAKVTTSAPPFVTRHSGNLVLISDKAITFSKLRPLGSKLLSESQNFRLARDRFSSESLFVYLNVELADRTAESPTPNETGTQSTAVARAEPVVEPPPPDLNSTTENVTEVQVTTSTEQPAEAPTQETVGPSGQTSMASASSAEQRDFAMLLGRAFEGRPIWPEAVGVAVNFEPESYIVRVFLVNSPENRAIAIPFLPQLVPGPPIVPAAPSILPSDTEVLISASLDYNQIYEGVGKNLANANFHGRITQNVNDRAPANPLATYEKLLGINLKTDLLPVLGNEVAVSFPLKAFTGGGRSQVNSNDKNTTEGSGKAEAKGSPVVVLAIKDRDAVRALIPKMISSLGFKNANSIAQTERKDDTELVSFANVVSYAFVGDFIVLSADNAAVHHVVDSYLNHQTLSSDVHFRNSTRWQPRQLLGQVYISPTAIDTYNSFAPDFSTSLNQKMVEFLMSLGPSSEAVTYALSNEGLGPLHELHVPRKLLMLMAAGMAGGAEQSREGANESIAQSTLRTIVSAEATFQATTGDGKYGSLEDLISNGLISKETIEKYGYRIEVRASGTVFESSAVPVEYGNTGKNSFFVDESGVLRVGDHGGGPATVADRPVN